MNELKKTLSDSRSTGEICTEIFKFGLNDLNEFWATLPEITLTFGQDVHYVLRPQDYLHYHDDALDSVACFALQKSS